MKTENVRELKKELELVLRERDDALKSVERLFLIHSLLSDFLFASKRMWPSFEGGTHRWLIESELLQKEALKLIRERSKLPGRFKSHPREDLPRDIVDALQKWQGQESEKAVLAQPSFVGYQEHI